MIAEPWLLMHHDVAMQGKLLGQNFGNFEIWLVNVAEGQQMSESILSYLHLSL